MIPKGLPFGIGFLGWVLDQFDFARDALQFCLDHPVDSIWLSFGDELEKYVKQLHEHNSRATGKKIIIIVQVNTVEEARDAVGWGIDMLVLQGIEAGGHGRNTAPPAIDLLNQIVNAGIPNIPPFVVAGGLASGKDLVEVIRKGAAGMVIGTGFLCTAESMYTDEQKQALISAKAGDTCRSVAWDELLGMVNWPSGINGRALRNVTVKEHEEGVSLKERVERFNARGPGAGVDGLVVWAGVGVGHVTTIKPAGVSALYYVWRYPVTGVTFCSTLQEIVAQIMQEAEGLA